MKLKNFFLAVCLPLTAILSQHNAVEAAMISVTDSMGNANIVIAAGTTSVDAYVRIATDAADAGITNIQAATIAFLVGDGGPALGGGTTNVPISAVNFNAPNSIWFGQPLQTSFNPPLPSASAVISNVTLNVQDGNVSFAAQNLLGVYTLDTSALTAGSGPLLLSANAAGLSEASRATGAGGSAALTLSFTNGSLSVAAVPEPASMLLLVSCGIILGSARRFGKRSVKQPLDA